MTQTPLIALTLAELKAAVKALGMPAFTAQQIARWLYVSHVATIDEMTNISKANRALLAEHYTVGALPPVGCQRSSDGTVKYLFPTDSGRCVETVYIPDRERATLCVSSQVGCKMGCRFCQTGKQGFEGNLTAIDIINLIYSLPERDTRDTIVFLGQGEPMDNLDSVLRATELLTADYAYAWSPRRITVSTVGVPRKLQRFLDSSDCHLAISLHSPLHEQRAALVPAEKAMPAAEMVALLREYDFSHQRRLSFEYTVFAGVNDSPLHARELVRLLNGLDCRINLIRYHDINNDDAHADSARNNAGNALSNADNALSNAGITLKPADEKRMEALRDYLTAHGLFTTIRASRGQDILAACGLLSTAHKTATTNS